MSASSSVAHVRSVSDHTDLLRSAASTGRLLVLLFTAQWHPPCKQMSAVVEQLAKQHPEATFAEVDAEGVSDVTELYPVESVPTSVLLRGGVAQPIATLEGANAVQLTQLVTQHSRASSAAASAAAVSAPVAAASSADATAAPASETKEQLNARLAQLVSASPVLAFIKGTPAAPRCGFTRQLLTLLNEQGVQFSTFDILSDPAVREGLKAYSNWPTYPQLYVSGELVGGLDIVKELAASGELASTIPEGHIKPKAAAAAAPTEESEADLTARLQKLVRSKRVLLFMKGSPSAPQCGFSRKTVALLDECGVNTAGQDNSFGTFDILTDPAVREGLKKLSNWPTYPQLYVDGELVGGLDVLTELKESGELQSMLEQPPPLEAKEAAAPMQ